MISAIQTNLSDFNKALISHWISGEDISNINQINTTQKQLLSSQTSSDWAMISSHVEVVINTINHAPFKCTGHEEFTFIDLFAGIGGFRMALQNLKGKCLFSSEWNKEAQETYFTNYGEYPFGDIALQEIKSQIPKKFDVLCAGFPCQPFSAAGHQKGLMIREVHFFLKSYRFLNLEVQIQSYLRMSRTSFITTKVER